MAITGEVIQHVTRKGNLQAALAGALTTAAPDTIETVVDVTTSPTQVMNAVEIEDGVTMSAHFIVDDTMPSADEMLKALNDTIAMAQRQRDALVDIITRQKHMDVIDQAKGRGKKITDLTEAVLQGRREIDNYKAGINTKGVLHNILEGQHKNLISIFENLLCIEQDRLDTLNAAWEKSQTTVTH